MADVQTTGPWLGDQSDSALSRFRAHRVSHPTRPEITGYDGMVSLLRNAPDNYRRLGLKMSFRLVRYLSSKT